MNVGDGIGVDRGNWSFGGNVSECFVDHARKSIPGYDLGHEIVCKLSEFFVSKGSSLLEIGCSTGELTEKIASHNDQIPDMAIHGLDIEEAMIESCLINHAGSSVVYHCGDFMSFRRLPNLKFVASYYCLQFVDPGIRQEFVNKIYNDLSWGGAFILFEKVRGADARFQDILTGCYEDFKLENGFSQSEIMGKTRSLRGVMEPFSSEGNLGLLQRAGFVDICHVFRHYCFEGLVAIK